MASCGDSMTDDQREQYEERAGILEFCAGMTREEAERVAMMQVTKAIGGSSLASCRAGNAKPGLALGYKRFL
jgi:hypothetical protein